MKFLKYVLLQLLVIFLIECKNANNKYKILTKSIIKSDELISYFNRQGISSDDCNIQVDSNLIKVNLDLFALNELKKNEIDFWHDKNDSVIRKLNFLYDSLYNLSNYYNDMNYQQKNDVYYYLNKGKKNTIMINYSKFFNKNNEVYLEISMDKQGECLAIWLKLEKNKIVSIDTTSIFLD